MKSTIINYFVMTSVQSSPVTCPPQHTHTITPEGNTLLHLLLKSLLPPTALRSIHEALLESMNTAEAKGREVYVDLELHCPKHKMPNAYHKSIYLPRNQIWDLTMTESIIYWYHSEFITHYTTNYVEKKPKS